jgi:hypothetical protein
MKHFLLILVLIIPVAKVQAAPVVSPKAGVLPASKEQSSFETVWQTSQSQTVAPGTQASWTLPPLPTLTAKIAALKIEMEGAPVLPKPGEKTLWTINGKPLSMLVGDGFGPPRAIGGDSKAWVLDVSDLVVSPTGGAVHENRMVLKNETGAPLVIQYLSAGYVPLEVAENAPGRAAFAQREATLTGPKVQNANFSVQLAPGGGLLLQNKERAYAVESQFSYPLMPAGGWNTLQASNAAPSRDNWKWSAQTEKAGFALEAVASHYRLQRRIALGADHVTISDTFTNTSNDDIAIAFDNKVTPLQAPRAVNVAGVYEKSYFPYSAQVPSSNPTIYFSSERFGLGMVALDDYYRLQFALKQQGRAGLFQNRSFGLPPGDSYTFEWALYPTQSGDYWDFINAVRRDHVPPTRIEGGVAFMPYNLPLRWSREQMAQWLHDRSAKIVIMIGPYGGAPWLGGYARYMAKMPVEYDEKAHLADLKKAREVLREIDPAIKCLATFETALTPDQPAGESTPLFSDSIVMGADGLPEGYKFPTKPDERREFIQTKAHSFIYYPTPSNSYYRHMRRLIESALNEAQADGIYFDIFVYTSPEFRWTYDLWDNRTVDMDLSNYTIARKKADVVKLSEDARAEIVQTILNHKKGNVVIANYMPIAAKVRALPIMHFKETLMDYGYMLSHFSTPIMLGWTPGYSPGAKSIGKQGTWWQEWKSDADFFADIKDKLQSGNLYYTYWAPPGRMYHTNLTRPTILETMFPITVTKIGAGIIEGKERIITLHSGEYSWGQKAKAKAYFYDGEGKQIEGALKSREENGATIFSIEVPAGGAAVIEKM